LVRSRNGLDIGLHEIVADVEQTAGTSLRHFVGAAIAEIQGCRVQTAPAARAASRSTLWDFLSNRAFAGTSRTAG
jgi:hypothetical protein